MSLHRLSKGPKPDSRFTKEDPKSEASPRRSGIGELLLTQIMNKPPLGGWLPIV